MPETMFEQDPNQSHAQSEQSTPPEAETKTKPPLSAFVEHQAAAAREAAQALQALIPPDFRTHSRAARKEFLTSFKVLLDGVSEMVDHELEKARQSSANKTDANNKPDDNDKPPTTGKSKVKVEVL